jgi:hypothetical protein
MSGWRSHNYKLMNPKITYWHHLLFIQQVVSSLGISTQNDDIEDPTDGGKDQRTLSEEDTTSLSAEEA